MLKGVLSYDYDEDIWFLNKEDGTKLDISGIFYNLLALGYDLDEGSKINLSIENS